MDPGRKKKLIRALAAIVALSALGLTLFTLATLNFSYSRGERVGFVQKLSHRGWICKTNEGDLSMVNLPGQPAENFPFTVPDDKLVAEINAAFCCASLGITPTVRHADYIGSWLEVLREDNRAIVRAASQASKAADWLLGFLPGADVDAADDERQAA